MQSKELKSRSMTCSSSFHAVKRERHHEYTMISLDLAKYEQLDACYMVLGVFLGRYCLIILAA